MLAGSIEGSGTSPGPGTSGTGNAEGIDSGARYTVDAMHARIEGAVWIECVVMPDGSVGEARVMRSLDRRFGLDEEAIAAAKRWRFPFNIAA